MRRKICIVSSEHSPHGGIGATLRRQAEALGARHEVTLIENPEPSEAIAGVSFAGEDHRRSAAVLEQIERLYGDEGPDLLEVCDYRAHGLVPLQARAAGHPSLRRTVIAVQLSATAELIALHDGSSLLPGEARVAELEREQLRLADRLIWPGGDILDLYRRYYRDLPLPTPARIGRPFPVPEAAPGLPRSDPSRPLRLLYAGRLQRLKGVLDLVEACLRLDSDDWQLTLIGADTLTAAMGRSVRLAVEAMSGGDPRIAIEDVIPREQLQRRFGEHDLLVLPSRFEVCAGVALEAMRAGLPVLATPVGAQAETVRDGENGWLCDGVGAEAIGRSLRRLLEDRAGVERVRRSGEVFAGFLRFTDPEAMADAYEDLIESAAPEPPTAIEVGEPLVTAVVPYFRAHRYVGRRSARCSPRPIARCEVLVVNDGSFEPQDAVLAELERDPRVRSSTKLNMGDGAARNLGSELAQRGVPADVRLRQHARARVRRARARPSCGPTPRRPTSPAGCASSGRSGEEPTPAGLRPARQPVVAGYEENWDGDTIALLPTPRLHRARLDYRGREGSMHPTGCSTAGCGRSGRFGAVIPERLARYRVLPDSLLRGYSTS